MHTIQKGDISKACVISKLLKKEFKVLTPISENSRYDLVIDKNNQFLRIQVKTIYWSKCTKCYQMQCCSSQKNAKLKKRCRYTENEVDFIIGYNSESDKAYIFPIGDIDGRAHINFRFHQIHKNQNSPLHVGKYEESFYLIR